jgi:hypothetical protein
MAKKQWPLEMAPIPMLPNGISQNVLSNYLRLQGLQGESSQIPDAPPVWPVPESSPEFNDPDYWLGYTRNALVGPKTRAQPGGVDIMALLSRMRAA